MKKLLSFILTICILTASLCLCVSADTAVSVKYHAAQQTSVENGLYSVRFVAVMTGSAADCDSLGFKLTIDNESYTASCQRIYSSILAEGQTRTAESLGGDCIFALAVKDIPVSAGALVFRVTPYVESEDTTFYGEEYAVVYESGRCLDQLPSVRIASLNLKNNTSDTSNISWDNRKANIVSFIKSSMPDSIGLQECEEGMYEYLEEELAAAGYLPANDTHTATVLFTEYWAFKNFIFYNGETTELLGSGEIWLANGGTTPTKSDDFYISAGWARLKDKNTGEEYVHVNTHLNSGEVTYRNSEISVLLDFIQSSFNGERVILTGDFNSHEDTDVYSSVTEDGFTDARDAATFTDSTNTYNGFTSNQSILDYCFFDGDELYALRFDVVDMWNEKWLSDHNALVVDFTFSRLDIRLGEIGSEDEDSMTWGSPNN